MNRTKNIDNLCNYILNKLDLNVLKDLSAEQLSAIVDAINACQMRAKHSFDIRKTINLYVARYYFAFFIGRDRRNSVQEIEGERRYKVTSFGNLVYFIFMFPSIIFAITALTILSLYGLKFFFGIDFFPGRHMGAIFGLYL